VREVPAGGDGLRVLGPLVAFPVGERRLEHRDRLARQAGRLVGGGEPVPGGDGVAVGGAKQPGAGGDHRLPVGDGGVTELAALQREPGPEQQLVRFRFPQQVAVDGPHRAGAVPQRLVERGLGLRARLGFRPGLKQRVGGGQHRLLQVTARQPGADRGLHAGVHPDGAHRAGRVDRDQAGQGQVVDGGADHVLVVPARRARVPGDVPAGRRAGQHRPGDAVAVHHGGQRQGRPGQPGRGELMRAFGGE
jgi:hypothetical protein